MDKKSERHRNAQGKFTIAAPAAMGRSSTQTAKKLGIKTSKVERTRIVLSDPEEKVAVLSGAPLLGLLPAVFLAGSFLPQSSLDLPFLPRPGGQF